MLLLLPLLLLPLPATAAAATATAASAAANAVGTNNKLRGSWNGNNLEVGQVELAFRVS